jgi:hypothetical protein
LSLAKDASVADTVYMGHEDTFEVEQFLRAQSDLNRSESWVAAAFTPRLFGHRPFEWSRYERYELTTDPMRGQVIQSVRTELVHFSLAGVDLPYELSRFGKRRELPSTSAGLLRLAHKWGLDGEWSYSHDRRTPDGLAFLDHLPPRIQALEDFLARIKTVQQVYNAYRVLSDARTGLKVEEEEFDRATAMFFGPVGDVVNGLLSYKLRWDPESLLEPTEVGLWPVGSFVMTTPPSLFERAIMQIVDLYLKGTTVRRCDNCGVPFSPEGMAWARADRKYCSKSCRQAAWRKRKRWEEQ